MRTFICASARELRAAWSSTIRACSRVTPWNQSTNWWTDASSARFSKKFVTGTRLPRNTHAPPTSGDAFDGGARRPINHIEMVVPRVGWDGLSEGHRCGALDDTLVVIVTTETAHPIRIVSMREPDRHEQGNYRENLF